MNDEADKVVKQLQLELEKMQEGITEMQAYVTEVAELGHFQQPSDKDLAHELTIQTTLLAETHHRLEENFRSCQREQRLFEKREARYRAMFELMNDTILLMNPSSDRIVDCNPNACRLLGYSRQELLTRRLSDIIPDDMIRFQAFVQSVFETGEGRADDLNCLTKSGEKVSVEMTAVNFESGNSEARIILASVRDVRTRQGLKQALRESEERWRSLVENAPDIILTLAPDGTITFINQDAIDSGADQLIGTSSFDYVSPEQHDFIKKQYSTVLESGEPTTYEIAATDPNGITRWYRYRIGPIRQDDKETDLIVIATDITDRRTAEEKLRTSEARYRQSVEHSPNPIFSVNREGLIQTWNRASEEILLYDQEIIGEHYGKLFPTQADAEAVERLVSQVFQNQSFQDVELAYKCKDGNTHYMVTRLYPIYDSAGQVQHCVFANTDITVRKKAEEALKYSSELQRIIINLSTEFINLPVSQLDARIHEVLKEVGEFVEADRSYVILFSDNQATYSMKHEWYAPGIEPSMNNWQNMPVDKRTWMFAQLANFESIQIPSIADWSPPSAEVKRTVQAEGTQSVLIVPLIDNNELIGFLGYDSVRSERTWSEDIVTILRVVGEILVNALERKRVQQALQYYNSFQTLITSLSAKFINLSTEEIDKTIHITLQQIGQFVNADRSYVGMYSDDFSKVSVLYMWAAQEEIGEATETVQDPIEKSFGWFLDQFRQSGSIQISNVADLPPEAQHEKEVLQGLGVHSVVEIPLIYGGILRGFLGFNSVKPGRVWSDDTITLLRVVGDIIVSALEHKRSQEILHENEARFRAIFEQGPLGMTIADTNGQTVAVNNTMCQMLGYTEAELLALVPVSIIHPEDRAEFVRLRELILGDELSFYKTEKRYIKKNGDILWANVTLSVVRDEKENPLYAIKMTEDITDRKRAEEAVRKYSERLRILHEIDQAILAAQSPEAIAQAALGYIRELIGCHRVSVELYDIKKKVALVYAVIINGETRLGTGTEVPLKDHIADYLDSLQQGQIRTVDDLRAIDRRSSTQQQLLAEGIRSFASLPLIAQGELLGALNLGATVPAAFPPDHIETAQTVASQLAIAIRQAHLYEQAQQEILDRKRAEKAERDQRLLAEALRRMITEVSGTLDLDEVLDRILETVVQAVPHESANIMLIEDNLIRVVRQRGYEQRGLPPMEYQLAELPDLLEIITTGRPYIISDTRNFDGWSNRPEAAWIRSNISAPIIVDEDVIGFLSLDSPRPNGFTADHADRLLAFADQAGIAIHNARLYQKVQIGQENLRQLAQQIMSVQEEERRRVSRELHDEAGQALIAVKMNLEAIRSNIPDEMVWLRSRVGESIDITEATMDQIHLLAQDLTPPALETLGLNAAVEGYCHNFARRAQLSIEYQGLADLSAPPNIVNIALYRFVQEALTNVAKHAAANRVVVTLRMVDNTIFLSVADDGRGFNVDYVISTPVNRIGIGLRGMKERLELLGGQLRIESHPGNGTRLVASVSRRIAE